MSNVVTLKREKMPAPKGNKHAIDNNGGRPALYVDPKEMQDKINKYFINGANEREFVVGTGKNQQIVKLKIYTVTGLAHFLGFESRQSFYDYEENVEFSYIIKRARLKIETNYEENLQYGNTTGAIFALKNMNWSDKQEIDHSSKDGSMKSQPNIIVNTPETAEEIKKLYDK